MFNHMQTNLQICLRSKNFTNLQCIRWRRKPRWLPVAKSKMFYVPPRTVTPENEYVELMRLYNNYHTQMKTIRSYLHSQHNVKSIIVDTEAHKRFFEEFQESCKINDIWNNKQQEIRERRHLKELELSKQAVYENIDRRLEAKRKLTESAEEIVRKEKEAAATFITRDNLDSAIQHALANPVDYNYAIDSEGNFHHGRSTQELAKDK